jgi:TRAP-type C4-dicarboxylate transport system substrate-binding protein
MKFVIRIVALCICLASVTENARAEQHVILLGTVAPEGSVWFNVLAKMKADMEKASKGAVSVRIYHSGRQGDESEMVRSVRQGTTLNAVALSGAGLSQVDSSINALQIPMLIDSYAQLDYVRKQLEPRLERAIESKGFVVLNWSDVGWVQFFSKTPARTPDDIRKLRLFTSSGDPDTEQIYKELGFRPVPTGADEILTALQTSRIEAFDVPPILAMVNQSFGIAQNMIDMKWSPLVGATLISRASWERIPEPLRTELHGIARKAGEDLRAKIRGGGDEAVKQMRLRGLNVVTLTNAEMALWKKEAEGAYPKIRGRLVSADLFDEAVKLSREYKAPR